jgi:hypothetical protein
VPLNHGSQAFCKTLLTPVNPEVPEDFVFRTHSLVCLQLQKAYNGSNCSYWLNPIGRQWRGRYSSRGQCRRFERNGCPEPTEYRPAQMPHRDIWGNGPSPSGRRLKFIHFAHAGGVSGV